MIPWPWRRQQAHRPADAPHDVFEQLAREHAPALYGAALRIARNPDDAQDLAQDTLVRAYAAFDSFVPGTNFRAWLLRILVNLYITAYRRRKLVAFVGWEDPDGTSTIGLEAMQESPRYEPETALLAQVMDSEIEAALAQLSEGVRLTVLLVDVEQLSYEEAAQALKIPVGTVRSRLNRGREQMRAALWSYAHTLHLVGRGCRQDDDQGV